MLPNSAEDKLKIFGVIAAILLLADLVVVNFKVFSPPESLLTPSLAPTPSIEIPKTLPTTSEQETACPSACLAIISAATDGATKRISPPQTPSTTSQLIAKEIYVPLGNGSTKNSEWVEISGAETVLDTANFSKIKSVIFEAFLSIPTGNGKAYAKLYNITDKHDVWFSEVMTEGGNTQRVESKNINFDAGRKVYRVMMKTTMGYEAVLESARLKIILE